MKRIQTFLFLLLYLFPSCGKGPSPSLPGKDYRQAMRDFVINLSQYAKRQRPSFVIVPQNGMELVTAGTNKMTPATPYLQAIDGNGQEELFYGYGGDNRATPPAETQYLKKYLDLSKAAGNTILVTDYCSDTNKINNAFSQNRAAGYLSFAAGHRALNNIPAYPGHPFGENSDNIARLSDAKNFLYLINPEKFSTKAAFVRAVQATNYDLVIMDLFFNDGTAFTASEIQQLKTKANGAERLVICYLSIGEAEDYRYYWNPEWKKRPPSWLAGENPDWPGNYKVKYWDPQWQAIIYGNDSAYLHKIMAAGFDGAYLDIVDAFEYFEAE